MEAIIDYGVGNLGSILNMFKRIGVRVVPTGDLDTIRNAEKIVLPGVGAFDHAMQRLDEGGFRSVLDEKARVDRVPTPLIELGIPPASTAGLSAASPAASWLK